MSFAGKSAAAVHCSTQQTCCGCGLAIYVLPIVYVIPTSIALLLTAAVSYCCVLASKLQCQAEDASLSQTRMQSQYKLDLVMGPSSAQPFKPCMQQSWSICFADLWSLYVLFGTVVA